MRKIYSLVLMAAALLVGTNAWADVNPNNITSAAELQEAIDNAGLKKNVGTVTLTLGSSFGISTPIWIGTTGVDDDAKSIKLNMNGYSLTMDGSDDKKNYCMFVLSHGELLINNNASTKSELQFTGSASGTNSAIFYVLGSYKSSRWKKEGTVYVKNNDSINTRDNGYFSHLEIGENVKLVASGVTGSGIIVDEIYVSLAVKSYLDGKGVNYNTNLFYYDGSTNGGLAQGVRVDIKGEIDFSGTVGRKSYGVKINGMVATTLKKYNVYTLNNPTFCDALYKTHYAANKEAHVLDTCDAPFVHIHKSAVIKSNYTNTTDDNSAAIYAGGYAKLLVEGTAEGNNALYARSGEIVVHDATLTTTADHSDAQAGTTGASGAGSALVANSSGGYAGQINITITGDTKISSEHGYAIEETVPDTNDSTQVQSITIEGGTIEGGDLGAIIVSQKTVESDADVTIYGGKVSGGIQAGNNGNENDLLPKDEDDNPTSHVTVVTIDGKPTIVVSEGAGPNAKETRTTWNNVSGVNGIVGYADSIKTIKADSIVNAKWTGKGAFTSGFESSPGYGYIESGVTVKLGELQMISGKAHNETLHPGAVDTIQQLRIMNGATLDVRHLMMNEYAQIIVEAGGKLIVEGTQGIIAPSVNNIILKTSQTAQAIFLFNPAVTANRHPNATVEFTSNSYSESANDYQWQRFGAPSYGALKTMTCETAGLRTFVYAFKKVGSNPTTWVSIGEMGVDFDPTSINTPFVGYDLICNQTKANAQTTGTVYKMTCELYGNDNRTMPLPYRFTPVANSYTAPIKLSELFNTLTEQNIYVCTGSNGQGGYNWDVINSFRPALVNSTVIKPMEAFMLHNGETMSYDESINYRTMVYNPALGIANEAPQRVQTRALTDVSKVQILVTDELGYSDNVIVGQSAEFSDEFENGYDAEKFMNDDKNLYVTTDAMLMATYATEELNNTYLGFRAQKSGLYTINFDLVEGEEFVLLDIETNTRTLMSASSSYQFSVPDNYSNDYRFKIVNRQEMPTDVETVENLNVSNDGIYTITGQYMGEMNVWNTLPSGLYIVNGEKKIK